MSDQQPPPPSEPYGPPPASDPSSAGAPGAHQQPPSGTYQQPPAQPGYGAPYAGGYPAPPGKPLDLAKLVTLAAWVVLGLFALYYLYFISNDDNGGEFVDRFFGGMDRLGEGIFYAGVLHAVGVWLRRNQSV